MKIPTKWQFIAKQCKKLGYPESAKIARKMDRVLDEIYKVKYTPLWKLKFELNRKKYIKCVQKYELFGLAENRTGCIGCSYNWPNCTNCKFGKKVGICMEEGSLFGKFFITLAREKKVKK